MRKKRSLNNAVIGICSAVILVGAIFVYRKVSSPPPDLIEGVAGDDPDGGTSALSVVPLTGDQHCQPLFYADLVQADCKKFDLPQMDIERLKAPLPGGVEFTGAQVLKGKKNVMETPHLLLAQGVEAMYPDASSGQTARLDHLILSITNKGRVPIAYRVKTQVSPDDCGGKGVLPHNALVLRAGETIRRTECLYRPEQTLTVLRVEVYELMELGHRYLSQVEPQQGAAFDMRVSAGHNFGGLSSCRSGGWTLLDSYPEEGWHMLVDFYARHNCEMYTVASTYRPFTTPATLPFCDHPPGADQVEAPPVVADNRPKRGDYTVAMVGGGALLAGLLLYLLFKKRVVYKLADKTEAVILQIKEMPPGDGHD